MGETVHKLPQSLGTRPASTEPTSTSIHLWKMVERSGSQSLANTGNGGGYTNGGYNAYYGGGASYAIGDEHDVGHNLYGGTA